MAGLAAAVIAWHSCMSCVSSSAGSSSHAGVWHQQALLKLLQGARNERRLVAVCCSNSSTFEIIHGLLNRVMEVLGVPVRLPGQGAPLGLHHAGRRSSESWPLLPCCCHHDVMRGHAAD